MNRDSVPILKLNVEFNFRNVIAEVRPQFLFPSGGQMSVEGVEMYKYGKDGLEESYVEQPHHPELNKKFSFEIQKATLNKKIKNLNFADLYVERWDEQQSLFISDIIVDVSKEPPIIRKKSDEAGSYNGRYSYEIGGKQFSENVRGSIPNYNN
jgi:hypothetical protein